MWRIKRGPGPNLLGGAAVVLLVLTGAPASGAPPSQTGPSGKLAVSVTGMGVVRSVPPGVIDCGNRCSATVALGRTVRLEAVPASSGGSLDGWQGACSGTARECVVSVEEVTKVRAAFVSESPTRALGVPLVLTRSGNGVVTSEPPGLVECGSDCSTVLSDNARVTLVATPAAGSVFAGWNGDCTGLATCRVVLSQRRTVYATFRPVSVPSGRSTVDLHNANPPPGGGIGSNRSGTVQFPDFECRVSDCARSYANGRTITLVARGNLVGWKGTCTGVAQRCVLFVGGTASISVSFQGAPLENANFGLSVTRSGEGSVASEPTGISCGTGERCSAKYDDGLRVRLRANSTSRTEFVGWGGDCSGTACAVVMSRERSVSATFRLVRHELRVRKEGDGAGAVRSEPGGLECGAICMARFVRGTTVRLSANPDARSTFGGWSGACSGTGTCRVTLASARSVTARFARIRDQLRVTHTGNGDGTVTSVPAGIACGQACSATFPRDTRVELRASPDARSRFTGWTGACGGQGVCAIRIGGPAQVRARFERIADEVRVERTGDGKGQVQSSPAGIACGSRCRQTFPRGTQVVLRATPQAGSRFAGWSGACAGTGACTVTLGGAAVVQARFTRVCATRSAMGFGVQVARNPRRVLVAIRLEANASARVRLLRAQKQIAARAFASLGKGPRTLRLNVPRSAARGGHRVVLQLVDSCGLTRRFARNVTIPRR